MDTAYTYGTKVLPKFGTAAGITGVGGNAIGSIDENFNSLVHGLSKLTSGNVPANSHYLIEEAWGALVKAHAAFTSIYTVGGKAMN